MARRVRLVVPTEVLVRDIDMRTLDAVDRASKRPTRPVSIASRELASNVGASAATVHRAVVSSVESGFLIVDEQHLENGAQLANTYALTKRGLAVLAAARDAGLV